MLKALGAAALLCAAPVILTAGPAAALTITTDQVTSAIGGTAFGIVGGPIGGFIGGVLGKEVGKTIDRRRKGLDVTPPVQTTAVQPLYSPVIGPGWEDRAVDTTPMRILDIGPAPEADHSPARRAPPRPDAPSAGVTLAASPDPDAPPGTLDYQLNRIVEHHPRMRAKLMAVADRR